MAKVCYCADDFSMRPEISSAILSLLEKERIHATSCMTQSPSWFQDAKVLTSLDTTAEIGLHLNFTQDFGVQDYTEQLPKLMLGAWTGQLSQTKVRDSIIRQWELFCSATGRMPDFVDGHQHVHQFPVIREALFKFLNQQQFKGWVRSLRYPVLTPNTRIKVTLLKLLGATRFSEMCQHYNIHQNSTFAGIYSFDAQSYALLNQQWLAQAQDQLLIMCHPALSHSQSSHDPIHAARVREFEYFDSAQFQQDCRHHHIQLGPLGAI